MAVQLNEFVFLLGAPDLEMGEIEKLLREHGCIFFKKISSWSNAYWETYQAEIMMAEREGKKIVGIELRDTDQFKQEPQWDLIDKSSSSNQLLSSMKQLISKYMAKPD
jgi:hypothetical protein